MTTQQALTEYYTARWCYHTATKGTKRAWARCFKQALKRCLDMGIKI